MDTQQTPYATPQSPLEIAVTPSTITQYRKKLIPLWIKFFGWAFIIFGVLVPFVGIFSAVTGVEGNFSFYGLEETGSVFSTIPLVVIALFIAHGACAFQLLFAKPSGVIACLILAYISVAICIFTMFSGDEISIRLELLFLTAYIIKLHKLLPLWSMPAVTQDSPQTTT